MATQPIVSAHLRRHFLVACVGVSAWWASPSMAVPAQDSQLQIETIAGKGWSVRGVTIETRITNDSWAATLHIDTAALPGSLGTARKLEVRCPDLELSATRIDCKAATIKADFDTLGEQTLNGPVSYNRDSGELRLALRGKGLTAKQLRVESRSNDERWTASVAVEHADAAKLAKIAEGFTPVIKQFTTQGQLSLQASLSGTVDGINSMQGSFAFEQFTLNNTDGSIATDKLNLKITGQARAVKSGWQFNVAPTTAAGQIYLEPLFLDLSMYPLNAQIQGTWTGDTLQIDRFTATHAKTFRGSGKAELNLHDAPMLRELDVAIDELNFPGAFANYLQPMLGQTGFKSLQTAGVVHGQIQIREAKPTLLDATLEGVDFDDGKSLALRQLKGTAHWASDQSNLTAQRSELSWQDGNLYGLKLGAAKLQFTTRGNGVSLNESTHIPVFDGAIDIDRLSAQGFGTDDLAFSLDANVLPIGVDDISRALNWPVFGGTLAGRITGLEMKAGVLSLATTLNAHVFDGLVSISHLRLEDIFKRFPRMHSDIRIDNLDLEQVTSTFSFGRITGRLSGEIRQLELLNWMPVSFDAHLETPPGDRSKHLISQRAVENIGSLGGSGAGVTAALSSGFLRFFDDFNYERLGIGCRVENDVCEMRGIAPAKTGYYLVKGSGIPRIDVIGNSDRVDWPRLVAQLKAISESSGPVVK